jgi:SAM-dependent methyltransferase
MGCGDGSWLVHLHRLVMERTLRGKRAQDLPLLMVGVDCNQAALERARGIVSAAGVPALLVAGDISYPDSLRTALAEHGLAIEDGLHIRAFVDHDRTYLGGDPDIDVVGSSSGAYVDGEGHPILGSEIERDLVAHLRRWAPHVRKHGLVILEAHCVDPGVARRHVGAIHGVAFDAYHGYSHQYPIDHAAFLRCCREAGLQPASSHERRYPSSRPLVAVSLNRLMVPERPMAMPAMDGGTSRQDTWQPDPSTDLEDGEALHQLLFCDGDLRYPRTWCSAATGVVVAGALEAIERRLADAQEGTTIRVLDYGAGTGLASIELLKACAERGFEQRLEQKGARLELHLLDLPSSWFAKGFALLRSCGWTRFHSLRGVDGRFRSLIDVTAGQTMDVVMANMVFHLIPKRALRRTAEALACATSPGGCLVWSSPDLGPAGPHAVLFHDPNRALRQRWLQALHGQRPASAANGGCGYRRATRLLDAVREVRSRTEESILIEAQERAARRILPEPHRAADVAAALEEHFTGAVEFPTFEILTDDILDTLLVPANQCEYLPEITDRGLREEVITELMLGEVLPAFRGHPGCTASGLNVQWTIGKQVRTLS